MLPSTRGGGNVLIPAAAEFAGIGFTKLRKFTEILRLRFIDKTNYYEHRGGFIFPEVHSAWKKKSAGTNQRNSRVWEIIIFGSRWTVRLART